MAHPGQIRPSKSTEPSTCLASSFNWFLIWLHKFSSEEKFVIKLWKTCRSFQMKLQESLLVSRQSLNEYILYALWRYECPLNSRKWITHTLPWFFFGFLSLRPVRTLRVPFSCLFAFALFVYIGLCIINIFYSLDLLCLSFIIYIYICWINCRFLKR